MPKSFFIHKFKDLHSGIDLGTRGDSASISDVSKKKQL